MGPIYYTAVHHRPSRGSAAAWQGDERFSALSAPWINKYRSLLIIYDNTALRTSLRTLDGQRVGLVIYPAAVWTRDVVVVRAGGWVPVTSPPSGWRQGAMNNENIRVHASVPQLPVRLTRGFNAEKRGASLFSLSARRRMLLNPRRLPAKKKSDILVRVNWFVNHSRKHDADGLIILTITSRWCLNLAD